MKTGLDARFSMFKILIFMTFTLLGYRITFRKEDKNLRKRQLMLNETSRMISESFRKFREGKNSLSL